MNRRVVAHHQHRIMSSESDLDWAGIWYGIGYGMWYGIRSGIWYGMDLRKNVPFTNGKQKYGNTGSRDLTRKYNDKIDFSPKPRNDPIAISKILYDGHFLESILKQTVVSNPDFPKIKANMTKTDETDVFKIKN